MRKADQNAESLYNSWTAGPISLIFVANEAQSNSPKRFRASVVNFILDAEISAIFLFFACIFAEFAAGVLGNQKLATLALNRFAEFDCASFASKIGEIGPAVQEF